MYIQRQSLEGYNGKERGGEKDVSLALRATDAPLNRRRGGWQGPQVRFRECYDGRARANLHDELWATTVIHKVRHPSDAANEEQGHRSSRKSARDLRDSTRSKRSHLLFLGRFPSQIIIPSVCGFRGEISNQLRPSAPATMRPHHALLQISLPFAPEAVPANRTGFCRS